MSLTPGTPEPEPRGPLVGVVMGSRSDWETMRHAVEVLDGLGIPNEARVVSAHRTPDRLFEYGRTAEGRGIEVIIAGAGGAAHLPGMLAAISILPVLGVPVERRWRTTSLCRHLTTSPASGRSPTGPRGSPSSSRTSRHPPCAGSRVVGSSGRDGGRSGSARTGSARNPSWRGTASRSPRGDLFAP